jgi:SHS2 domain-containing protein
MAYRYRDDIATADVAFEAWGETPEAMFTAAAEATMKVMVADLETISPVVTRRVEVGAEDVEMLLFALLQELIFYKDAEQLLLRVVSIQIHGSDPVGMFSSPEKAWDETAKRKVQPAAFGSGNQDNSLRLTADARGETINPDKHDLIVDVKAVTLHRFKVERTARGWEALVVLDI